MQKRTDQREKKREKHEANIQKQNKGNQNTLILSECQRSLGFYLFCHRGVSLHVLYLIRSLINREDTEQWWYHVSEKPLCCLSLSLKLTARSSSMVWLLPPHLESLSIICPGVGGDLNLMQKTHMLAIRAVWVWFRCFFYCC